MSNPVHEMLRFAFATKKNRPLRLLCLGAHSDDIEIGCGGTGFRLLGEEEETSGCWGVLGARGRGGEGGVGSGQKVFSGAERKGNIVADFRGGVFPYQGGPVQ